MAKLEESKRTTELSHEIKKLKKELVKAEEEIKKLKMRPYKTIEIDDRGIRIRSIEQYIPTPKEE